MKSFIVLILAFVGPLASARGYDCTTEGLHKFTYQHRAETIEIDIPNLNHWLMAYSGTDSTTGNLRFVDLGSSGLVFELSPAMASDPDSGQVQMGQDGEDLTTANCQAQRL